VTDPNGRYMYKENYDDLSHELKEENMYVCKGIPHELIEMYKENKKKYGEINDE